MSAVHRIDDAGEMEAAVFFMLVYRLPAYAGVIAALASREADRAQPKSGRRPGVERRPDPSMHNNARAADSAPAATADQFAALNAQLGDVWFSHRVVSASG